MRAVRCVKNSVTGSSSSSWCGAAPRAPFMALMHGGSGSLVGTSTCKGDLNNVKPTSIIVAFSRCFHCCHRWIVFSLLSLMDCASIIVIGGLLTTMKISRHDKAIRALNFSCSLFFKDYYNNNNHLRNNILKLMDDLVFKFAVYLLDKFSVLLLK